jgi:hypothetical protein
MDLEKTVSLLCTIALTGACFMSVSTASAAERVLAFHGSLVSAGCDARVSAPDAQQTRFQSLKVNRQITLSVDRADNACGGSTLPVIAGYVEQPIVTSGSHTGIVTLSYQ